MAGGTLLVKKWRRWHYFIADLESGIMREVMEGRAMARIEGDFVIFLIGMRINKPWKVSKWLPVFTAMPKMLKELDNSPPEVGFLGHTGLSLKTIVQYWRSFEHLEQYARSSDRRHWPAWVEFNRRMKNSRGDVGIWHETYCVKAGNYEAIYSGMPLYGLASAGNRAAVSAEGDTARKRLNLQ
jgi:hypothetical protein